MSQPRFEGLGSAEVVIGEAVALEVPIAGLGTRMLSSLIDLLVQTVLLVGATVLLFGNLGRMTYPVAMATSILISAGCLVGVPFFSELASNGRTLGKLALGIRTARTDHGPITVRHALVRALVGVFEIWMSAGSLAIITAMMTKNTARLGDLAAGTIVVRQRLPLVVPAPAVMPARLEPWAHNADLASLPPGLAMGIRQFLLRREQFSPRARGKLAAELLHQVRPLVSPAPPEWAAAEEVLLAVLAERGRRDTQRLVRADQLRRRLLTKA